ncbi:uncharacterized protein TNCV_4763221 [Trichonephila clavipes]|nr:uncharacterized protein TNCV_4763221 [Trichonephila clavipes]
MWTKYGTEERKNGDEAHFWLNGYVNKQNCRIWSEANPQVYVGTPLHPEKLTVWCALWARGIVGPPELNNHDVQELWFQRDGATYHTARATIDLLKDTFGDRLMSRFGPVNWPQRSCDLTPLDYLLWIYVKALVRCRALQTALVHFRCGHLRGMIFVQGVKSLYPCSLPAFYAHPLDCRGIFLGQLYEDQDLLCDILMRKGQMDLV